MFLKKDCLPRNALLAWQIDSNDYKRICVTWNKSIRKIQALLHNSYMDVKAIVRSEPPTLSITASHFTIYKLDRNVLITACVKSAINNANSPLGHNIAYFRNNYGINFSRDMCFNQIIHPPRLCEEKRMIIAQLNDLLLVKCGLYAIVGFTMSNIDALIELLATE